MMLDPIKNDIKKKVKEIQKTLDKMRKVADKKNKK
jgi:hypothetical protein